MVQKHTSPVSSFIYRNVKAIGSRHSRTLKGLVVKIIQISAVIIVQLLRANMVFDQQQFV